MKREGIIFVISGPSGSGKGTVCEELRRINPDTAISVSATTRSPREGEVDGVSYHFITRERFEELIEKGEVLEYTQYNGNYYGTLRSEAEKIISDGRDLILEIEVDGGGQVKRLMGDRVCGIMLIAPDAAEQEKRLRGRGTESEDVIAGRLARAKAEILEAPNYDYIVINETGKTAECAADIMAIMRSAHYAYSRMKEVTDGYFDNK
ncbi:MAG: guanylate kinase [Ruminococcaceae bacterium]|nr:guanylate kinase [Oscillospiraceae bacterium]